MKYTAVLLDLDGTIFDFHAAQRQAFFETFAHFGIAADEAMLCRYDKFNDSLWQMLEHGEITRERLFKERFKLFFEKENIKAMISPADVQKRYMQALSGGHFLIDGALDLLKTLHGNYKVCAITNGVSMTQRKRLSDSNTTEYFDHLVISEEVGFEKPDRRYFEAAVNICGITDIKKAIVVGDSLSADIFGGGSFGFDTCWYNPNGKPFNGKYPPTYIISHLSKLNDII